MKYNINVFIFFFKSDLEYVLVLKFFLVCVLYSMNTRYNFVCEFKLNDLFN